MFLGIILGCKFIKLHFYKILRVCPNMEGSILIQTECMLDKRKNMSVTYIVWN